MRTLSLPPLSILLSSVLFLTPMLAAVAQQRDDGVAGTASPEDAGAAAADASATATGRNGDAGNTSSTADVDAGEATAIDAPRSGFGQVMSVLTSLLHDAAQREATGRGDGFALDNPAIEISVTPVEGQTSLLRASPRRHAIEEGRRGERGKQLAAGTTP